MGFNGIILLSVRYDSSIQNSHATNYSSKGASDSENEKRVNQKKKCG